MTAGGERLQRTLPFCLLTSQLFLDAGQKCVDILTLLGAVGDFVVQGRLITPGCVQLGVFFLKGLNRCSLCSKVCLELGDALGQGLAVSVCLLEGIHILLAALH